MSSICPISLKINYSRVSQYVYVEPVRVTNTKDTFFTTLDQHADTLEGDVKLPLVIIGNEGTVSLASIFVEF